MYFILCLKGIYLLYKQLDCPGIGDVSPPGDYGAGLYLRVEASLDKQILPPVFCRSLDGNGISQSVHGHHARVGSQVAGKGYVQLFEVFSEPVGKLALDSKPLRENKRTVQKVLFCDKFFPC